MKKMFQGRMEEVKKALELAEQGIDKGLEDLQENILSYNKTVKVYMRLKVGEVTEGFEFDLDPDNREIFGGRYSFRNWFDKTTMENKGLNEEELEQVLIAYGLSYDTLMG